MSIFVSQGSSSKSSRRCWFVLSAYVYVHVDVGACVCWCCRGVARVSQAFVQLWVMWSCISIPAFVWPCSPCSPADQRPSSYLSCSLNCGPQCCDLVTFSNNREINSAPPITLSASHPANQQAAGLFFLNQRKTISCTQTHTTHTMISVTARHTANSHAAFIVRVGANSNFFISTTAAAMVASGSSSHGDGSP